MIGGEYIKREAVAPLFPLMITTLFQPPAQFINPPREFSVLPFWFWNDELSKAEITRQIADFEAHGIYGFVIHPRVGLPRDTGWMSDKLLGFVQFAVEEAARRDMRVVLYDEGMYPSGSSSGQVVAENPAFACRCLAYQEIEPGSEPELFTGQNLVSRHTLSDGREIVVVDQPMDSVIRGLHYTDEDESVECCEPGEDEPPASDLLNPAAMQCFVRLVYDGFFARLGQWFGNTIIGMFTDEPALLGRPRAEHNFFPGTTGIVEHVSRLLGYDFAPHLPALWFDDEPDAARYRADYLRAVNLRLDETYYAQLSAWCKAHGVALMGHPAEPEEMAAEAWFDVPGQDVVWRDIEPDKPSALQGPQSTQAKCSSSAMLHQGKRRNSNECFGAFGHEFTEAEMHWLSNWLFVRGVNMLIPHAFYYSLRGLRRDERPPDVGPGSPWWLRYQDYARYTARLSWLNTDSRHVCNVAILGEANRLPWGAAGACFENQRDFNYIEAADLCGRAEVSEDGIRLAGMHYEALVLDGNYALTGEARANIEALRRAGRVVIYRDAAVLITQLDTIAPRDLVVAGSQPGLRYRHISKDGIDYYLLFNEAGEALECEFDVAVAGERYWLCPWSGEVELAGGVLQLGCHELKILVVEG